MNEGSNGLWCIKFYELIIKLIICYYHKFNFIIYSNFKYEKGQLSQFL